MAEIIKTVISSAAEAKLGALYINAHEAIEIHQILQEMGHPQPPIPMQTDNLIAEGIINSRVQPKCTKAIDMRFHWLHDHGVNQKQFQFFWQPGAMKYADYWMIQHPSAHHQNMHHEFLTPFKVLMDLQRKTSTAQICNKLHVNTHSTTSVC